MVAQQKQLEMWLMENMTSNMTKKEKKADTKAMLTEWAKHSSQFRVVKNRPYYLYNDSVKFWFWSPTKAGVIMTTAMYDVPSTILPDMFVSPEQVWDGAMKLDGSREDGVIKLFADQEELKAKKDASRIIT